MSLDPTVSQGALIASRAVLSAILVEIAKTDGRDAVERIRLYADSHLSHARHEMHSDAMRSGSVDDVRVAAAAAEAFVEQAFQDALAPDNG